MRPLHTVERRSFSLRSESPTSEKSQTAVLVSPTAFDALSDRRHLAYHDLDLAQWCGILGTAVSSPE